MYLEAKPVKNLCTKITSKLPQNPWFWFIGLWVAGFVTLGVVSYLIKMAVNLGK